MKMPPLFVKAQANMQPGVLSSAGFLGDDDRLLADIIARDEEAFQKLGLDFSKAAESLRRLMNEGRKGLGEPITVEGKWRVQVSEARGVLACPFEDGVSRKTNATVELVDGGRRIYFSDLSLHLMEVHHFLQGKGSPFRLEPEDIKQVLGN